VTEWHIKFWEENLKDKDEQEGQRIDGEIILKWI
jgi:hypothetical protein